MMMNMYDDAADDCHAADNDNDEDGEVDADDDDDDDGYDDDADVDEHCNDGRL